MKPVHYHLATIAIAISAFCVGIFLYTAKPKSIDEALTKTTVATGIYQIDKQAFERGIDLFRRDEFPSARDAFELADPKRQNAEVQFYIAYSFYRQGWGRFSNDDTLFRQGIAAADQCSTIDPSFAISDSNLTMRSVAELSNELKEGIAWTLSDLDPRRLARERK